MHNTFHNVKHLGEKKKKVKVVLKKTIEQIGNVINKVLVGEEVKICR